MENFTFQNLAGQHVVNQQLMGQNIIQWPPQAVQNAAQTQVLILAQQNPAVYVGPTGQLYTTDSLRQQQQWINCFPSTSQAVVDTTRDPWQVAQSAMEVAASESQIQYATVTQPLSQVTQPLNQVTQQMTQNTMTDMSQMYTEADLEAQAVAETLNHLRNQQMVNQHVDSPGQNSYSSNNLDPEPEASNEAGDWITIKIDPMKNQKAAGQTSAKDGGKKKERAVKVETMQVAQVPMQPVMPMQPVVQMQTSGMQTPSLPMQMMQQAGMVVPMHSSPSLSQAQHTTKIETTVQTIDIELMESLDPNTKKQTSTVAAVTKKSKKKKAEKKVSDDSSAPEKKPRKGGADSKAGSYKCNECGALFAWARNLNRHMRKHTGQRPYACESCEATFTQNSHLKVHRLKHTGERPYVCKTCQASFTRSSYLNRHTLKHTESAYIPTAPSKNKKSKSKASKEANKLLPKPDPEAGEQGLTTINYPDALGMGVVAQTNGMKETTPKKKKKKKDPSAASQAQADTAQDGALNLTTHIKQEVGVKQEVMEVVSAVMPQAKPAVSRHTGQRHECKVCSATFLLVSSLNRHMLKHSEDKGEVFSCKQCDEVFTQADHLARHALKHAGEKRHICVVCSESFGKSSHLAKHFMTKHPAKPKAEGAASVYQPTDS